MKNALHATTSIRRRLLAYLSGGLLALWLATALASAAVALHEINEIADSQMNQLARSLMQVPQAAAGSTADLPPVGGAESSNNGFAIWDKHGTLLLADRYGREIPFQTASGFHNNRAAWQGSAWRYLYLHDEHSGRTVAVSQRLKERLSTLTNALWVQFAFTFLSLPLLLWLIARGIRRGLMPLDLLAGELAARNAQSLQPVSEQVPAETLPLVIYQI